MQGFGFGQNSYGTGPSAFNMGGLFSGFGSANAGFNSGSAGGGFNWKYFLIGLVAAAFVAVLLYFVVERADTRPVVSGFADLKTGGVDADAYTDVGDMNKPAEIAKQHPLKSAPAVPSEEHFVAPGSVSRTDEHFLERMGFQGGSLADTPLIGSTLYSAYVGRVSGQTDTLLELQQLEAKLAAFTADLTSADKQINASKLVQYNTYQDIRPLGDWTAQCFSKNVPERDITLQMERWFLSGKKTLADLNKAAGMAEDTNVATLASMIDKVKTVAMANCVATAHTDIDALGGPRDPTPYAGSAKTDTSAQFTPL